MNLCVLMGRLTATPELRKTQSGVSVTSFTIAINRRFKTDGEQQADFINCVAWRQTAEFITKYFDKGSMIAVEGTIQTRKYTDKNGNDRTATEVIVNQAHFTGSKRESGGDPMDALEQRAQELDIPFTETDDDLPF